MYIENSMLLVKNVALKQCAYVILCNFSGPNTVHYIPDKVGNVTHLLGMATILLFCDLWL